MQEETAKENYSRNGDVLKHFDFTSCKNDNGNIFKKGSSFEEFVGDYMIWYGGVEKFTNRMDSIIKSDIIPMLRFKEKYSIMDLRQLFLAYLYRVWLGFSFEDRLRKVLSKYEFIEVISSKELDWKYAIDLLIKIKYKDRIYCIGVQCKSLTYITMEVVKKQTYYTRNQKAIDHNIVSDILYVFHKYGQPVNNILDYKSANDPRMSWNYRKTREDYEDNLFEVLYKDIDRTILSKKEFMRRIMSCVYEVAIVDDNKHEIFGGSFIRVDFDNWLMQHYNLELKTAPKKGLENEKMLT